MVFSSTRINFVSKYLKLLMTSQILLAKTFAFIFGWHLYSESEKRKIRHKQLSIIQKMSVLFALGTLNWNLSFEHNGKDYYALEGAKVYIF